MFCSPCHGRTGRGDGMVVQRGFKKPSSYRRLSAQMPIGYFYDVITIGFGAMPDYAAQVAPRDRWAIAAYVRTLQFSQYAPASAVPADSAPSSTTACAPPPPRTRPVSPARSAVLERLQQRSLAVGGLFLLALAAGFLLDRAQFFRSYLLGYLFWVEVAVGALGLSMLSHLTGGLWGVVPRRFHEAAARTFPALALGFVPIALGASSLYLWARAGAWRGRAAPGQGALPQRAVLPAAGGLLLRAVERPRLPAQLPGRGCRTARRARRGARRCAGCRPSGSCSCSSRPRSRRSTGACRSRRTGSPPSTACCSS